MNLRRRVWLPPDGDVRLIRFQEDLAARIGRPGETSIPPYLQLAPGRIPRGAVTVEGWGLDGLEPVLGARDADGPVGVVRFGLPWPTPAPHPLPGPPSWSWSKGRLADLVVETPDGGPGFVLWSWENPCGWRSDQPRA